MSYSVSKKFTWSSLIKFALPTTVMMVVMSLYSIVDGVFISRYVGTMALSSVNIVWPPINVVLGVAVMFAAGSNAIIARKMGEGKPEEARRIFTFIVLVSVALGVCIAVLGNLWLDPMIRMLGASDLLMEDCRRYLSIQMLAAPAMILQLLFQTYFVTEGKPGIGLFLTSLAGVVNIVFDYLLIVPMGWGVAGAAIATAMGYAIPAAAGIVYFIVSKKVLYFVRPEFSLSVLLESCGNGSSEMVGNLSSGVITFLFNLVMMRLEGEDGVAAITIIQYSQFLLSALFMGFSQGVSPVISYNYGSRNTRQLKQVFKTSFTAILAFSLVIFILSEVFGKYIVEIFARSGTHVYDLARGGFSIFAVCFLFSGINIFASALFTALGDGRTSAIISFVRTFCLIVTSLLILPALIGLTGVWLAIPLAELGGMVLSVFFLLHYQDKYGYMQLRKAA